jgi:P-type E1-E2 ATPase
VLTDGRVVGGNPLDQALWEAPAAGELATAEYRRLAARPFDYERQLASALVQAPDGRRSILVKGAPETVLDRCRQLDPGAQKVLDDQFAAGSRVIAVATRPAGGKTTLAAEHEADLELTGFLTFLDQPKPDAAAALARLKALAVEVKVITGDNDRADPTSICVARAVERDGHYLVASTTGIPHLRPRRSLQIMRRPQPSLGRGARRAARGPPARHSLQRS